MKNNIFFYVLVFMLFACKTIPKKPTTATSIDDGLIEVVFLQINDVYEISPIGAENLGGLARVAQIRKDLLAKNPNTYTVCAGDFISPSIIGTLKHEGKRIRGKQMIDVFNAMGLDYTAFGNHEFDYDVADLQSRLDESTFTWIGSNIKQVTEGTKAPFMQMKNGVKVPCPENIIISAKDADGTTINIGIFSPVLPANPKPYVAYEDHTNAVRRSIESLRARTNCIVGLTHLAAEDDKKLLEDFPEVPLIMGGHEHENQLHQVGKGKLAKADANAKTVYIHTLVYNQATKSCHITSELKKVDASIKEEPTTAAVVAKWESIKNESIRSTGFDPTQTVTTLIEPLDCRETTIRKKQAKVGEILNAAMHAASKTNPDCSFFNAGSIRVDDLLLGGLTEVDIIRMLPFGGAMVEIEMTGTLLHKTLEQGLQNAGSGGYLQWGNITNPTTGSWLIGGKALDVGKTYKVALPEFLLTGSEKNLGYLRAETLPNGTGSTNTKIPSITKADPADKNDLRNDIRKVLIHYWRNTK